MFALSTAAAWVVTLNATQHRILFFNIILQNELAVMEFFRLFAQAIYAYFGSLVCTVTVFATDNYIGTNLEVKRVGLNGW